MTPDPLATVTGAVDAAMSRLRTLNVPEAEIARVRAALVQAGEGLQAPGLVQPVAARNFGERGSSLAHHTALAHERLVAAINTIAESFDTQSASLGDFRADMLTREEEATADLAALRAATEQMAEVTFGRRTTEGGR